MDQPRTDIRDDQKAYLHDWINEQELESSVGDIQGTRADDCLTIKLHHSCLCVLQKICQQLSPVDPSGNDPLCGIKRILQEELGRLYLCGEGFSTGDAADALEYSDELRKNFIELLCGIGSLLLNDIPQMLTDKMPSMERIQDEHSNLLTSLIDESKSLDVIDSNSEINDSDSEEIASCLSNDYDPCDDLRSLVQMVLDLVPSLEANIQHQKRIIHKRPYAPEPKFQASDPAQTYISLVHDKFPLANKKLKERLGEANWQRHLNIRRRMEQLETHQKQKPEQKRNVIEIATNVGSVFQPQTLFHDSGIATTVASHSQYAQTEASHTSFVSSLAEHEKGKLRVPPTPLEVGSGKLFWCYLCGFLQTMIKNRIDWKRHVFQDLLPYICTFPHCKNELRQFATRQAWADHEFEEHRTIRLWACPKCSYESKSSEEWSEHLKDYHPQCFSKSQISSAISTACKKISKPVEQEECFLCSSFPCKTRRSLVAHIGKHMEEVALMALPRDAANDAEESSGSEDGSVKVVDNSSAVGNRTHNENPFRIKSDDSHRTQVYPLPSAPNLVSTNYPPRKTCLDSKTNFFKSSMDDSDSRAFRFSDPLHVSDTRIRPSFSFSDPLHVFQEFMQGDGAETAGDELLTDFLNEAPFHASVSPSLRDQMRKIYQIFCWTYESQCEALLSEKADQDNNDIEKYLSLIHDVENQIVLKLDQLHLGEDRELRNIRKHIINKVQRMLDKLEKAKERLMN